MKMIRSVLFDLDGTLLDTADDIANLLNTLLAEHGRPPLPHATIRPVTGTGATGLLQLGEFDPTDRALHARLHALYKTQMPGTTRLFEGVAETLDFLDKNNMPWGIVTNRLTAQTTPLLEHLPLLQRARCVVSGDTTAFSKPHPAPLLHACELLSCPPAQCVYIGDMRTDVEASLSAGVHALAVTYGYTAAENPADWGAHALLNHLRELPTWLNAH